MFLCTQIHGGNTNACRTDGAGQHADTHGELQQANAGSAHQVGQIDLEYHGDGTKAETGGSQQHGGLKNGTATRQDNTPYRFQYMGAWPPFRSVRLEGG